MEVELQITFGETSFNEEDQQYMFCEDFDGFRLTHKVHYGPHEGADSHVVHIFEAVPNGMLQSQWRISAQMERGDKCQEETCPTALTGQFNEITDMLRKRKQSEGKRMCGTTET